MGAIGEIVNSKPVESLTHFLKEIVGKPLIDGAGILYGDGIKAKRISNSLKLEEKYNLVKAVDTQSTTLSFGYKLLEKASLEDDDDLLSKWANLLSNATDKNYTGSIRKIYIEILESLEPIDVKIFDEINQFCFRQATKYDSMVSLNDVDYSKKETLNVLLSLGLLTYGVSITQGITVGGQSPTVFHGLESFKVTEMGQSFYNSVNR